LAALLYLASARPLVKASPDKHGPSAMAEDSDGDDDDAMSTVMVDNFDDQLTETVSPSLSFQLETAHFFAHERDVRQRLHDGGLFRPPRALHV
jgi:hypothetical protein